MTLLTAHKILISAAIVFFLFYTIFQLVQFLNSGVPWAFLQSAISAAVTVGLVVYLKWLPRQ